MRTQHSSTCARIKARVAVLTIISLLAQSGTAFKAPPVAVSLPDDLLIPYSPPLEDEFLPSVDRIAEAARASVRR